MVGGERSTFAAAQGVLNALGPGSKLVGTVGNELNICLLGCMQTSTIGLAGAGHALKAANNVSLKY